MARCYVATWEDDITTIVIGLIYDLWLHANFCVLKNVPSDTKGWGAVTQLLFVRKRHH